jgi:hypothetical protein
MLGITMQQLAMRAGITEQSLQRFEKHFSVFRPINLQCVKRALEDMGIEFIPNGVILNEQPTTSETCEVSTPRRATFTRRVLGPSGELEGSR